MCRWRDNKWIYNATIHFFFQFDIWNWHPAWIYMAWRHHQTNLQKERWPFSTRKSLPFNNPELFGKTVYSSTKSKVKYFFNEHEVDLLFNVLPIVCGISVFVFLLLCITPCPFKFCNHLEEDSVIIVGMRVTSLTLEVNCWNMVNKGKIYTNNRFFL